MSDHKRLQILVNDSQLEVIKDIEKVCSFSSKKDLFNTLLTYFKWLVDMQAQGYKAAAINMLTKDVMFYNIPQVEAAIDFIDHAISNNSDLESIERTFGDALAIRRSIKEKVKESKIRNFPLEEVASMG